MNSLNRLESTDQAALLYKLACKFQVPSTHWTKVTTLLRKLSLDTEYIQALASFVDLQLAVHNSEFLAVNLEFSYLVWDPEDEEYFLSPFLVLNGKDYWPFNKQCFEGARIFKKGGNDYFPQGKVFLYETDLPEQMH